MKYYIAFTMFLCFALFSNAQDNYYAKQWAEVTELENEGLTKSAAKIVENIYNRAKTAKDKNQIIKSLLHQSKYLQILEEDAQLSIVNNFKSEIEHNDIITKHLLENILANIYWQYFQQNRWKFYNRTKTSTKVDDDFRTWDLETLFTEIHIYYQKSLQNGLILQQEPLKNYDELLITQKGSKQFRPTLFDFLAHNALGFYKTSESSITQPAYKFKIDDPDFIADAETFIDVSINSKDSVNTQLNALKIYQSLLKSHRLDKTSKAFITNDIERLNFVKEHATFNTKEQYITVLETSAAAITNHKNSGLYLFEKASLLQHQAMAYDASIPSDDTIEKTRWKFKEAITVCDAIIAKYPESDAAKKSEILKRIIKQPHLELRAERFLPVDYPSRILVNYQNLEALDFDLYRLSKSQLNRFNKIYKKDKRKEFLDKLNSIKSWSSSLKNESDYQKHSTEVFLPKLQNGLYIIKAKTKISDAVFALAQIQVTDLALVETPEDDQVTYQVINRNNGRPITNVPVKLAYSTNRNNTKIRQSFFTDAKGKFVFKRQNSNLRDVNISVTYYNDTAYFGDWFINRNYLRDESKTEIYNAFLFTDRSIYRPGQTIYFKGIVTKTFQKNTKIAAKETVFATLHNVNGEKLSELNFETNDYGSFHGEFILPNGGLTGQFYIRTEITGLLSDNTYFSVEEYKRPKFATNFRPITETYKVNDSVSVNGEAIAFAGSKITGAKVVYNVKRQIQLPRWYYWSRPYFNTQEQEIINGETTTDANGNFEIVFKAIPDESIKKDDLPIFRYEVTADVTDLNGETRSATTIVNIGYHSLLATLSLPSRIDKKERNVEFEINTTNLNDQFVPAKGTLKVYKLNAPQYVLRQRPWRAPDYQVIPKDEFKKQFPYEAYTNEDKITNWNKGKLVLETDFDTKLSKSVSLKPSKRWASGVYIVVLETKDKLGQIVKDKAYTTLYSNTDKSIADNQLFSIKLDKDEYTIGDTAILNFGSAAKNVSVTITIEKDQEIIDTDVYQLDNAIASIELPISQNDLGGFVVHYGLAAFNNYTSGSVTVNVPYPKTNLKIETSTFRDKLQPGQDETWAFTIKGPKGNKVAAEVLASMYDMSLDQFKPHKWQFNPLLLPNYYSRSRANASQSFGIINFRRYNRFDQTPSYPYQSYDRLNWFGFYFGNNYGYIRRDKMVLNETVTMTEQAVASIDEVVIAEAPEAELNKQLSGQALGLDIEEVKTKNLDKSLDPNSIQIRKNLQETAFFFPQLQTDKDGNVSFNFKAPEALTKWKLQLLAHTKTLASSIAQFETVTQKELMVIPNVPRFLREGDEITISTKIANLNDKTLSGKAQLILTDALTGKDISQMLIKSEDRSIPSGELSQGQTKLFSVGAKNNTQVSWALRIPESLQAIEYKIIAKSEDYSDGEQNVLPILSNRMLVTETLPMWVHSNQTKTFTLDKLSKNRSTTLKNHRLTLEITSNPAWYALQALPYLMEYPYDCNEQTFARYYANAIGQHIANSNPKIKTVFNQWASTDALISNLEKNQDLKNILIQETPWLRDAQSETEQKKRIALLFDLNKMSNELQTSLQKLKNNQHSSGAWPWFNGGYDNRYITQHIVAGFGHLKKLNITSNNSEKSMIYKAIEYLDAQFVKEYKDLTRYNDNVDLTKDHLSYTQLHYLYVRSFYPELKASQEVENIISYYKSQIENYWLKRSLYAKGLMALSMHRMNDSKTASKILKSLQENSITSEELGMYWKENTNSWYWYRAPIETQAILIEAFSEIGSVIQKETKHLETIDHLKVWLLKNKQTNQWKTTKATTDAVYALLLQGSDWLSVTDAVEVKVGDETINPETLDHVRLEAGTGYYKTSWNASKIQSKQAKVTLRKRGEGIAWGALYWQYFEDLDKITPAATGTEIPLKLKKKLFLKTNTDRGEQISEITSETKLNIGDLVKVRIELRSDRDMEFIHLKDMRAAGLEPVNVISQYKWQEGLGYYESTKDAATNFFIDYLSKGIYIFEYDLRVNNAGNMSNGITTVQSMYAPEFSNHSEGVRVSVESQK